MYVTTKYVKHVFTIKIINKNVLVVNWEILQDLKINVFKIDIINVFKLDRLPIDSGKLVKLLVMLPRCLDRFFLLFTYTCYCARRRGRRKTSSDCRS